MSNNDNEVATTQGGLQNLPATLNDANPFAKIMPGHVNAGAVMIESERAIAEARGRIQLAKMFPRDLNAAYAEVMEACKLPALADIAFYSVPQGGQKVTGESIKLIEQIAASMGNFEWGHRELSRVEAGPGARDFGRSEVEVFAWDKEKNNLSSRQITVLHIIDTRDGPRKLRDQRDIDNRIANIASKQMRGRLRALLPKWVIQAAADECRKTITGNNDQPMAARIRAMIEKFAKFGVKTEHIERYLGHPLSEALSDDLVDLGGVYNSIKEGTRASEFFGAPEQPESEAKNVMTAAANGGGQGEKAPAKSAAKSKAASKSKTKAKAAEPEPEPEPPAEADEAEPADAAAETPPATSDDDVF